MNETLLKVDSLSLKIGEKEILKDVSFSLNDGEWLTIIGHNGSGKSSLIKSIVGLFESWTGDILFSDKGIRTFGRRELAKLIGYVPQNPPTDLLMTVKDFLLLSRFPYRNRFGFEKSDFQLVDEISNLLNLDEFLDRNFSSLSGGEKQKVMIAALFIQETKLIILDEPSASLDPSYTVEIMKVLKEVVVKRGLTVIEVSHDINSAALFSDRIIALKGGRLIKDFEASELMKGENLFEIYDHNFITVDDVVSGMKFSFPDYGVQK